VKKHFDEKNQLAEQEAMELIETYDKKYKWFKNETP
jgi:hypothetical protein